MNIKLKIELLIKEENFIEAEEICKYKIKNNSKDFFYYKILAIIFWKNKSYNKVIEILENYLKIDNQNYLVFNSLGIAFIEIHKYREAIKNFESSIALNKKYIDGYNNLGIAHQKIKNYEISIGYFQTVLNIDKDFYQAYNNIGISYFELGEINKSIKYTKKSLLIKPQYFDANLNLSNIYLKNNNYEEALIYLYRVLEINPKHEDTIFNIAKIYNIKKENDKAIHFLKKLRNLNKNNKSIIFLCNLLIKKNLIDEADSIIKEYLEKNKSSEGFNTLGQIKFIQRKNDDSLQYFQKAVEIDPNNLYALYNLGKLYQTEGDYIKAEYFYKLVLDKDKFHFKTINNYYEILCDRKEYDFALEILFKCLENHKDNSYIIHNNIGIIFKNKGDIDLARKYFLNSISINNTYDKPYFNLASIDFDLKNFLDARSNFKKALELNSDFQLARYGLMKCLSYLCLWDEYNENIKFLGNLGIKNTPLPPLGLLSMEDDPLKEYTRAVKWSESLERKQIKVNNYHFRKKNKRIKIGFFSSDFREHPVMFLLSNFFKLINREIFEVHAYSNSPFPYDSYTYDVIKSVDNFIDLFKFNDYEAKREVDKNNLDIAIDLNGHTQFNRIQLFKYKLAPIHITYLGYPGTIGSKFFDYIIADEVVIPPKNKKYFTEKVIYLPSCFMCTDDKREIAENNTTKKENNLPEDSFVYACFNSTYKITKEEFEIWIELLKENDKTVLWLRANNNKWKDNLKKFVNKNGVNPNRIIFADNKPINIHIARHKAADLFLDTFNYNAHSTAADILWAGKPIVTLCGRSFSARVCSSLLKSIKVNELITFEKREYKQLALKFAQDNNFHKYIEKKINMNIKKTDLFNTKKFVENYEKLLLSILN